MDAEQVNGYIAQLCEGNVGALSVLMKLDVSTMQQLDAMNIRGSRIWIAYKYGCNQNLDELVVRVEARDPELVRAINAFPGQDREPQVVVGGAA